MAMASPAILKNPCLLVHRQSISMAFSRNLSSISHKVSPRLLPSIISADSRRVQASRTLHGPLVIRSSRFKLFSTQAFPNDNQNPGYGGGNSQNPNHGNTGQGATYGNNQQSQQPWQQTNRPNPNYGNYRNPNPGYQQAQQPGRPQQQGFGSANNQQSQQQGFGSVNTQQPQQPQQGNSSGPPPPRTSAAAEVIDKHLGPSPLKLEKRDGNSPPPPPPPPRNRNFGSQGNQERKSGKDLVAESAACAVIEKYLGPWPGFPPRDPKIDEYLDSLPENAACIAIDKYFGPYKPLFVFKKNEENANNPPPPPNRPPRNRMMNRARNRSWNPSQQDQQPWTGSQSGGYQGQGSSGMQSQQTRPPSAGNNPSTGGYQGQGTSGMQTQQNHPSQAGNNPSNAPSQNPQAGNNPSNAPSQNPTATSSGQSPPQGNNSPYQGSQGSIPTSQGPAQ